MATGDHPCHWTAGAVAVIIAVSMHGKYWFANADACFVGRAIGYGYGTYRNVAVASEGMLEFMTYDGQVTSVISREFTELTAVTYDPARGNMYLTDSKHDNASIFQLNLHTSKITPLVPKQNASVQGVAYDPITTTLYWTNGHGRTISKMSFGNSRSSAIPMTLHKFQDEIPIGIAVDNCKRFLYWTNSYHLRPSIERSALDGTNREVIVKDDLFQPLGIAVDQATNKLYWSDDREGIYYKIERSDLDGTNRRTVHQSTHHQPFSLTVGPDYIFWSDWIYRAVWSLPKKGYKHEPAMVKRYPIETPMGLVAQISTECHDIVPDSSEEMLTSSEYMKDDSTTISQVPQPKSCDAVCVGHCLNDGILKKGSTECDCPPGYSGRRCEIPACYMYCVHGSCYLDRAGFPQCKCQLGYEGERCHVDVCENYCLNGGRCNVGQGGKPVCSCASQFKGQRCERSQDLSSNNGQYFVSETIENMTSSMLVGNNVSMHDLCSTSHELNEFILIGLSSVIIIQLVIMFLLVRKVFVLRKRPRIKKRIIVNKNVTPLTSRPPQQGEQCEITIENCCNMNICETPCFEPQLRTSKTLSKTEEKKNLLGSMEEPQSCPPCHEDLY